MRRSALALAAALVLTACTATSSDPRLAQIEKLTSFCKTYAVTLDSLSSLKAAGELTAEQIDQIDTAVDVLTPTCKSGPDNVTDQLIDRAFDAVLIVNAVLER